MQIIAHRGASKHAPENTLKAFALALEQGADGIELDTYQHQGEILVFHDRYLERTTNGEGPVEALSLAALRQLDAGDRQPIPWLREVFALFQRPCLLNIEIKGMQDADSWLSYVASALSGSVLGWSDIIVSSFNHHWLQLLKQRQPALRIGALTASCPLDLCHFATQLQAYSVHIDIDVITPAMVADAHRRGLKAFAYTLDRAHDWQRLYAWEVDGIFTNVPLAAKAWLATASAGSG